MALPSLEAPEGDTILSLRCFGVLSYQDRERANWRGLIWRPASVVLAVVNSYRYRFIWWWWSSKLQRESAFTAGILDYKPEELYLPKVNVEYFLLCPLSTEKKEHHAQAQALLCDYRIQNNTALTSVGCQSQRCMEEVSSQLKKETWPANTGWITEMLLSVLPHHASHPLQEEQIKCWEKSVQTRHVSNIQRHGLL